MSIKALSDYTTYARYARYNSEKKRRETWREQVDRVFDMHEKKYASELAASEELRKLFDETKDAVYKKKVLGSQRALQFGGDPILKRNDKIYNCAVTYVDRPMAFSHIMYMLLCGCGVGFSVQRNHVKKLPSINKRHRGKKTFQIPDTIEGWADAIGVLVNSYFVETDAFAEYNGYEVEFDPSLIRPKGAMISGGFKAPGPDGLMRSLEKIKDLIEKRLEKENRLHPIDYYDIIMHASDAVLSGGVRRSATICLFSWDDEEMMKAKTGNWYYTNPQRGRSNNSVVLIRNKVKEDEFDGIIKSVKEFGEPGFIFSDHEDIVYNPCISGDASIPVRISNVEKNISMEELVRLVDDGESIEVLSVDTSSMARSYKPVSAAALTRKKATLIKLITEDGKTLKCTPDHKIWTNNRGWVEAKDLTEEDDLEIQ